MLVLSRKRDQSIVVGNDVEITIVSIRGNQVRLGIAAPTHVAVHRKEIAMLLEQKRGAVLL